ncbi:hypothetical protein KGM_205546 [Danaus plexippus plexippus]|uniref:Uncharacterized protein n=1 Tax=Danaus plexippus plexippus TaxID=278856 RepID=A0A212FI34_DANPL|nr:hypothetical protein KGM_205546 [Danaus plexippus plexippus]
MRAYLYILAVLVVDIYNRSGRSARLARLYSFSECSGNVWTFVLLTLTAAAGGRRESSTVCESENDNFGCDSRALLHSVLTSWDLQSTNEDEGRLVRVGEDELGPAGTSRDEEATKPIYLQRGPFFARPSKEDDCEGSQRPSRIMMSEGFNERGEYKQDVKMLHRS